MIQIQPNFLELAKPGNAGVHTSIAQAQQFLTRISNNGRFPMYISNFRDMRDAQLASPEVGSSAFYLDCLGRYQPKSELNHQIIKYLKSRITPDLGV
jgi:hypothetical protein